MNLLEVFFMYFITGSLSVLFGVLMVFLINLFSVVFPSDVISSSDQESLKGYFQFDLMVYPIVLIILGVLMIALHFFKKTKN